jgi:Domain of unknown function (DUF4391)
MGCSSMTVGTVDDFLRSLGVPAVCKLDKPLFKKMFLEEGTLNATDKAALKDDVDRIRWLYTLKPETINIASYVDEIREYDEVAILLVELSDTARYKRVADFIQRSIPYPLLLIFKCVIDEGDKLAINVADKRINQADKEKWVIEDSIYTDWIDLDDPGIIGAAFLDSLAINNLSFKNFWGFYKSLTERVIAYSCAVHGGDFRLEQRDGDGGIHRLVGIRSIERLADERASLANKLKREKQMGKKVELNTKIRNIDAQIEQIRKTL